MEVKYSIIKSEIYPNPRLAYRYAKSLIDLAIEKDQLEKVYEDMLYCSTQKAAANF